jgi:hypothetical protein
MIRRFNYTGRRRIRQEDAQVSVRSGANGPPIFSAQLSLDRYRLPADAQVFVEAQRSMSFMRFPWGRVRQLAPPSDRALTEFGTADGIKFRVKVVEATADRDGRPARVLALADQIRPQFEEAPLRQLSLLEIVSSDLDNEVWKLDFTGDDEPKLLINKNIVSNPPSLARDDRFVSLVLPQILRTILTQVLVIDRFDAADDGTNWRARWLQISTEFLGAGKDPPQIDCDDHGKLLNQDDIEEWVEDAAEAFVRKFHIGRQFKDWWDEKEAL